MSPVMKLIILFREFIYYVHIFIYALRDEMENKPKECNHSWWVYSTAIEDQTLEVECPKCKSLGAVLDPTSKEWAKAFYAPQCPYKWREGNRVHHAINETFNK
ncbi:hypothetical protein ACMXYV_08595 [Neptuniibacter sp. SY11_33]|uniref:hypothetical protein n=1 Tax=Neptuniibacter sp. SY11_33 TaxID=3398215 RepID=UPI0039F6048D